LKIKNFTRGQVNLNMIIKRNHNKALSIVGMVILFIVVGCNAVKEEEIPKTAFLETVTAATNSTLQGSEISITASPSASATIPVTYTHAPPPTKTPTVTPSPIPEPIKISPDNLDRLELVEQIGDQSPVGEIYQLSTSLDGKFAFIFGERVMVYALDTGEQELFTGDYDQAALSPDGSWLALTGLDQNIEILAVDGHQTLIRLGGLNSSAEALAWSPDGEQLAAYDRVAGLLVWDTSSGELVNKFPFTFQENAWFDPVYLKWSPDGQRVGLAGVDQNVRVIDGDELIILKGFRDPVTHLDWSPDGTRLAASSRHDPTVFVWRVSNWNQILSFANHMYWVSNVAWSPDSQYLATADASGTAFFRSANNGSILHYFPNQNSPDLVSWSPGGEYLLEQFFDEFKFYDVSARQPLDIPETVLGGLRLSSWIPGSQKILISNADSRLQLWDIASGETEILINPQIGKIVAADWSPDGTRLALGEEGGSLLLYDQVENRLSPLGQISYPYIKSISWSPDGNALAVSSNDQNAVIEVVDGIERLTFGEESWRYFQDWHHPADFILSGAWSGKITLWDPHTGKLTGQWNPLPDTVQGVGFSPDFERVILLANNSIALWDVANGRRIAERQFNWDTFMDIFQWSPDGSQIVLLSTQFSDPSSQPKRYLRFLDPETLDDRLIFEIEGKGFDRMVAADICWSPDGSLLALNSGEIRDGRTGTVLFNFEKDGRVTWTPDGKSLIVFRNTMEIWQVYNVAP
jgi:WD40 repeat protein